VPARRRGTAGIVTVSALDLFASALGAFMLLTLLMMPFWLKQPSLERERVGAEAELQAAGRAAEEAEREATEAQADLEAALHGLATARGEEAAARDALEQAQRAAAASVQPVGVPEAPPAPPAPRVGQIRIHDLDLVFVMDTTGSMRPALEDVQASLLSIVRILARLSPSLRVGFVSYRDHGEAYVTREMPLLAVDRANTAALLEFVQGLRAAGGSDEPEAVAEALEVALAMRWRPDAAGRIVVIGDAPAHRPEAALALARRFTASAPSGGRPRRITSILIGHDGPAADFFTALAAGGGGNSSPYQGQMLESVLLAVLDADMGAAR
jgi:hypothetical protein